MKTVKRFISTIAIIMSGMIISSLWINPVDENWKLCLPICLCCITLRQSLDEV